jgi:hypothetical protein
MKVIGVRGTPGPKTPQTFLDTLAVARLQVNRKVEPTFSFLLGRREATAADQQDADPAKSMPKHLGGYFTTRDLSDGRHVVTDLVSMPVFTSRRAAPIPLFSNLLSVSHAGGRPRRFAPPIAARSRLRVASPNCSCSKRSSVNIR